MIFPMQPTAPAVQASREFCQPQPQIQPPIATVVPVQHVPVISQQPIPVVSQQPVPVISQQPMQAFSSPSGRHLLMPIPNAPGQFRQVRACGAFDCSVCLSFAILIAVQSALKGTPSRLRDGVVRLRLRSKFPSLNP